jgi:hypothetical protein
MAAAAARLFLELGDALEQARISVQRGGARLLAGLDDALVEVSHPIGGRFEGGDAVPTP